MSLVSHENPIPFQTRTWTGPLYKFKDSQQAHLDPKDRLSLQTSLTRQMDSERNDPNYNSDEERKAE